MMLRKTDVYERWFTRLRDPRAKARIEIVTILLCGGDKSRQDADIAEAKALAKKEK